MYGVIPYIPSRRFRLRDGGVASWYQFACAIAEDALAAGLLLQAVTVTPITTAEYPTAAHRPANSVLDCSASIEKLNIKPPHWRQSLGTTLAQLPRVYSW